MMCILGTPKVREEADLSDEHEMHDFDAPTHVTAIAWNSSGYVTLKSSVYQFLYVGTPPPSSIRNSYTENAGPPKLKLPACTPPPPAPPAPLGGTVLEELLSI